MKRKLNFRQEIFRCIPYSVLLFLIRHDVLIEFMGAVIQINEERPYIETKERILAEFRSNSEAWHWRQNLVNPDTLGTPNMYGRFSVIGAALGRTQYGKRVRANFPRGVDDKTWLEISKLDLSEKMY